VITLKATNLNLKDSTLFSYSSLFHLSSSDVTQYHTHLVYEIQFGITSQIQSLFTPPPSYRRRRLICFRYICPGVHCQYQHSLLCTNTQRISMYPGQGSRIRQKNPNRRQTGAATVANDFKNFTVHTARLVCRAGKSIIHIQRQRYHMTTSGL